MFNTRFNCLNITKCETEDFTIYSGFVNKQCEGFKISTITDEQFKCLIFACGPQVTGMCAQEFCQKLNKIRILPLHCHCSQVHSFLFEMWTQQLNRLLWKIPISGQVVEFYLCQGYWLVVPFWLVCIISTYNSHITMFGIRAYIPCYHLAQDQEGLGHEGLVLWQKEHQGIRHGACSCDLFLLDLSCRNSSSYSELFLLSRPLEWQRAYSSFYHSSNLSSYLHVL